MPYIIRYVRGAKKPYKIINKITGKKKGESSTRSKAEASIRAIMASEHRRKKR